MSDLRKKPCCICRQWFRPNPRVGARQRVCGKAGCRALHRQKTQASWRRRNLGYAIAYRIDQRAAQTETSPETLRVPAPLNQLPWEFAKDEFGSQRADFIGVMGSLMVRTAKDEFRAYLLDSTRLPAHFPPRRERRDRAWCIVNPQATMQLEVHQLERRWEHLRVRQPQRQRRLMASLAESGQQTPIGVGLSAGERGRQLVLDGYKRVTALEQLER